MDQILNLVISLLPALAQYGAVGKVLATVVAVSGGLAGVVTAIVGLWKAAVGVLKTLSILPGMGSLAALADKLAASEAKVEDFEQSKLLPVLNRLSVLPLPKKSG